MLTLIHCKNLPILAQLQLEEALLRTDTRNICLINEGSEKSIVLGISCKPEKHLDTSLLSKEPLSVIQRFSGGGSVVVDENTLFISWIFNKKDHPVKPFPEPILQWTGAFYKQAWGLENFSVQAQDYTIGSSKCGGNAQYIQKHRWLHHTTFLWDYDPSMMHYLAFPPKVPLYRKNRSHDDFLYRLKDLYPKKEDLVEKIKEHIYREFAVEESSYEDLIEALNTPHRTSTTLLNIE